MMRVLRLIPIVVVLFGFLAGLPTPSQAQTDSNVCSTVVKKAVQDTATICNALGQGAVCYGNKDVEATFSDPSQSSTFANPGDMAKVSNLKTVHTSPIDLSSQQFGVAALNLGTLAADGSANPAPIALMAGDVNLAFLPAAPNVSTSTSSSASSSVSASASSFTAEQNIMVLGASVPPDCADAEALFALRSQDNTQVPLTVNTSNILLGGLITFHWESANSLSVTVHTGSMQVVDGPKADAGQTLVAVTQNDGTIVLWSTQRTATDAELQDLADVTGLTGPLAAFNAPASASCPTTTYVIQPGETLFSIATRYGTTVAALATANNIANPNTIYAGQKLNITSCTQPSQVASNPQPAANNQPASQPTPRPYQSDATPQPGAANVALDCGKGGQGSPGSALSQIGQLYGSSIGGILGGSNGASMPSSGQNMSFPCK